MAKKDKEAVKQAEIEAREAEEKALAAEAEKAEAEEKAKLEAEKVEAKEKADREAIEAEAKKELEFKASEEAAYERAKRAIVVEQAEFYVKQAGHFAMLQKDQIIDSTNYDFEYLLEQGVKLKPCD
jgi:hypothetical protein